MKNRVWITLLVAFATAGALAQQESRGERLMLAQAPAASQKTGTGTGLIQQIDREKGAITIKHGPLQGLNMMGMTMTFLVKDKAMLSNLQPLQKVEFDLTYDGKDYRITRIK